MNEQKYIPSMICVDYYNEENNGELCGVCLCISNEGNIYSFGKSVSGLHGHKKESIFPPKKIKGLNDIKMIYCGGNHTCCLDYSGNCYTFGSNNKGQLGIGKTNDELEFTYKPQKINIPSCKYVACGYYFTICLTEEGNFYTFGNNQSGQLGLGHYENCTSPQQILDITNVEYYDSGAYHNICKTYNGTWYSWGSNYYGQLGNKTEESKFIPNECFNWPDNIIDVKCGSNHSILLTLDGTVFSFGSNKFGRLGINDKSINAINFPTLINNIPEIKRIECGYTHTMFIDIEDNLWVCGYNGVGQLGLGDKDNRYKPTKTLIENIIDISSGGDNIFIKTIDNKIYANGSNTNSEIGDNSVKGNQLSPIQVLKGREDLWSYTVGKSRAKSARK